MRTLRLAHRGDWRQAPENSLAALAAAARLPGVDGVEFDVRASSDREPVVVHDATLARTHGDARRVADLTALELARLGVPTLASVLAALPSDAFLDVELKEDVAAPSLELLRGAGRADDRTVVSSFDRGVVERCGALDPGVPRWLNARSLDRDVLDAASALRCRAVCVERAAITPGALRAAAGRGLAVACFTVRQRLDRARLERLGVIALCVEGAALDP